jgi:hypothetical protein
MKLKLFLIAVTCFCLAPFCAAQSGDALPANEEMFILGGNEPYYGYGRYLAPNQIAIGLTDEGVYELRNDSVVWLVNQPRSEDRAILTVRDEEENELTFFLFTLPHGEVADTVAIYDSVRGEIFRKNFSPIASVDLSINRILSPQAEPLLLVHFPKVNKRLAVFFFLYHYLPLKQQGII